MKKDFLAYIGSGVNWILTITQTNEIFQLISLILSILTTLLTFLYIIYKWYKKATEDGKIEPEEIEELIDDIEKQKEEEKKKWQ